MFEIKGRVAIVSGGASGIGLECTKELLRNGLRGVVIADINEEYGVKATEEINVEFGDGRALFVQTDVSNKDSYEEAFKQTIDYFQNIDILINNAGIMNDKDWEREIAINLNGTINGILLALEHYIPKYRTSKEGVIVNVSSSAGLHSFPPAPIYSATKYASRALNQVRVLTVCPSATDTALLQNLNQKLLGPQYHSIVKQILNVERVQTSTHVSQSLVKLIKTAKSGTSWVVVKNQEAYEFVENEKY